MQTKTVVTPTARDRVLAYVQKTGKTNPESVRVALRRGGPPVPMSEIRAILAENGKVLSVESESPRRGVSGISLSNVRVSTNKPNEGMKGRIYGLKRGQGYPLDELATEWCVSPETLRLHARRCDALRYVEVRPGQWVQCVLHPDTAASFN